MQVFKEIHKIIQDNFFGRNPAWVYLKGWMNEAGG